MDTNVLRHNVDKVMGLQECTYVLVVIEYKESEQNMTLL